MKLIRVFPRKTNATPDDENVRLTVPTMFDEADEVHISVTFTWDLPKAEWLEKQWRNIAPTKIGGVATGMRGEEFVPGLYMKYGYTITSRGCPNRCWFCSVWKREGNIRELEIKDGWNLQDDNLLACSDGHIRAVFEMLKRQKRKAELTGGLEASRLQRWHVELMKDAKVKQAFFAYDTSDDYEPLRQAGKLLQEYGLDIQSRVPRCYVLVGSPKDKIEEAEKRMRQTLQAGFIPQAMLWRNNDGDTKKEWRKFQRQWARPAIIMSQYRRVCLVKK